MTRVAAIAVAAFLGHSAIAAERPASVESLSRIASKLYLDSDLVKRAVNDLDRAGWDATSPQGPVPIAKRVTPGGIDYTFLIIQLFQRKAGERGDIDALLTKVTIGGASGDDRVFIQAKPGELQ